MSGKYGLGKLTRFISTVIYAVFLLKYYIAFKIECLGTGTLENIDSHPAQSDACPWSFTPAWSQVLFWRLVAAAFVTLHDNHIE